MYYPQADGLPKSTYKFWVKCSCGRWCRERQLRWQILDLSRVGEYRCPVCYKEHEMAYRKKMKRSKSKKQFSKYADKTHRKNIDPRPMRGGIRL